MKACEYCGRENEELAIHCRECGTEFAAEAAASPAELATSDGLESAAEGHHAQGTIRTPRTPAGKAILLTAVCFILGWPLLIPGLFLPNSFQEPAPGRLLANERLQFDRIPPQDGFRPLRSPGGLDVPIDLLRRSTDDFGP